MDQGMTIIEPESNQASEAHFNEYRTKWGIPFGRPGAAIDYAQCIFSLVTVCPPQIQSTCTVEAERT